MHCASWNECDLQNKRSAMHCRSVAAHRATCTHYVPAVGAIRCNCNDK
nr:MAG TPA: hypothetical protein [Caudoviricetes sp.]